MGVGRPRPPAPAVLAEAEGLEVLARLGLAIFVVSDAELTIDSTCRTSRNFPPSLLHFAQIRRLYATTSTCRAVPRKR